MTPTPHDPSGADAALPAQILSAMVRSDSTRPRLTFYDDAPGPTQGERIELSARVLANWVAKAGNALQEELDAAPGTTLLLAVPTHWRAVYWALAAWSVGATVHLAAAGPDALGEPDTPGSETAGPRPAGSADVVVTDDPDLAATVVDDGRAAVILSLPMLSRAHPAAPAGAFDEARELATYGDVLDPWEEPDPTAPGLVVAGVETAFARLGRREPAWGEAPRVLLEGPLATVLPQSLAAWSADGSVVLVRGGAADLGSRVTSEGVTVDARGG